MKNRVFLALAGLALAAVAMADTAQSGRNTYRVTLLQPSVVNGTELRAGDYKLAVNSEKAVFSGSKQSVETSVKVENGGEKFAHTAIRFTRENGKAIISEIRVGGTNTKLVFDR
jgi:hypothetical protein